MAFNIVAKLLNHLLKLVWFVPRIHKLDVKLIILIFKSLDWNLQRSFQIYLWFQYMYLAFKISIFFLLSLDLG